jgi:hypothetical protein
MSIENQEDISQKIKQTNQKIQELQDKQAA